MEPITAPNATPLGNDIFEIDTRMGGFDGITAAYLIRTSKPCLVETGAGNSADIVTENLRALGLEPGDLATIVVTHIHLDHAGGVGDLAERFPNAEIVVHERGARHLADPARLMNSARMVWGDRLDDLFGDLRPTPAERIRIVEEAGSIDLGDGRELASYYSPGHAKHHIGLLDSLTGDLYVGDAAGVYLPETGDLRPATPPPDFDLDTALESLAKFGNLAPQRLLFSHFGPVHEVDATLERSAEELRVWVELVAEAHGRQLDFEHTVTMIRERTASRYKALEQGPEFEERLKVLSSDRNNVAGILHAMNRSG